MANTIVFRLLLAVSCIVLLAGASCALTALEVNLNYNNGQFTVTNVIQVELAVLPGTDLDEAVYETQKELGYANDYFSFALESAAGQQYVLHEKYPKVIYYDSAEGGGGIEILTESNDTYIIPYYPEAAKLSIYNANGSQVYTTTLFQQGGETNGSEGSGNVTPPASEPAAAPPAGGPDYLLILVAIVSLAIVAIILYSRRRA